MTHAGNDNWLVRNDGVKLDIFGHVHQRTNCEIYESGAELLQTFQPGDVVQTHLNLWMGSMKQFNMFWKEIKYCRHARCNLNVAFVNLGASQTKLFVQILQLFNERAGHFVEEFAFVRELNFRSASNKQG